MVESVQQQQPLSSDDILVQCVKQGSKLRMRIINSQNYSNLLNCSAPKTIRLAGAVYKLSNPKVLVQNTGKKTFYKLPNNKELYQQVEIGENNQVVASKNWLTKQQLKDLGIPVFEESECVICLVNPSTVILLPCSHKQFCKSCIITQENTSPFYSWQKKQNKCVICRQTYIKYYEIVDEQ